MNLQVDTKRVYQQGNNQLLFPRTQLICICMDKDSLAWLSVFGVIKQFKDTESPNQPEDNTRYDTR